MSQKLRITFAVFATFIACSSSSSEVQTNLQAEGKHYVRLSFLIWSLWNIKQMLIYNFNLFWKKLYFSENENRNETSSDLPKPHIVIIGATGLLNYKQGP